MPVGSAFGFIIGSQVAAAFHSWRYALRVSPPLGAIMVLFAIFFMLDPPRGVVDGHEKKSMLSLVYFCMNTNHLS